MMDESVLSKSLLALFTAMKKSPMTEKDYADNLAKIITDHIKTAEVQAGIAVSTEGRAVQQAGTTTGTGKIL